VNQSVLDLGASLLTLFTATVEVDGNNLAMLPLAAITVATRRGGWHWHVAGQCQRSVRLSYLADETAAVGFHGYVDLQHSAHGFRTLRRRHLFYLVQ